MTKRRVKKSLERGLLDEDRLGGGERPIRCENCSSPVDVTDDRLVVDGVWLCPGCAGIFRDIE